MNAKPATPLERGATIYSLTSEERAVMKRLTDARIVVSIGEHGSIKARLRTALDERRALVAALRGMLDAMPCDDYAPDTYGGEQIAGARALLRTLGEL